MTLTADIDVLVNRSKFWKKTKKQQKTKKKRIATAEKENNIIIVYKINISDMVLNDEFYILFNFSDSEQYSVMLFRGNWLLTFGKNNFHNRRNLQFFLETLT